MKLAIIGDIHFNIKSGSKVFQKNIKKFCDNVLFPTLLDRDIKVVLQSGDIFDSRTSTNSEGLYNAKQCFFSPLDENDIHLHLILGNHDLYYKESLSINTPELVLSEYHKITIHKNPTTVKFGDINIDFLSWICDENREETLNYIAKSKSDYCFAHLELAGFKMSKSYIAEHGMDSTLFKNYKQVWSGHYHSKSQSGNILYVGNPSQDTWESVDEIKGFHIFDTETKEMEFIENPYNLYERVVYDDSKKSKNKSIDFKDKYVRVVVEHASDVDKFEKYIQDIWSQSPYDVKVIENKLANVELDSNITMEELESNSFSVVPFLTQYTIKSNVNLTTKQKEFANETYKKLYNNSRGNI